MMKECIITDTFNPPLYSDIDYARKQLRKDGGKYDRIILGVLQDEAMNISSYDRLNMTYLALWGNEEMTATTIDSGYSPDCTLCIPDSHDYNDEELHRAISKGCAENYICAPVMEYIRAHGLYHSSPHPWAASLKAHLSAHRYAHTLSVAKQAVALAGLFHVNPIAAHTAGLLHDCAKGMDSEDMRDLIRKDATWEVDADEISIPALLHAPAGAILARDVYGVRDKQILSAIRWHTTGKRDMTPLEKVVYLADLIEPERMPFDGLETVRAVAKHDLNEAVKTAAQLSVQYVLESGKKLHPRTVELAEYNKGALI